MLIAPGSSFFQDFGTALVILFLYTLTACFFFFELFLKVKVLCYSHSKGQPLDGGCICYRNICIAWQQYNKTFQDAVLVFLFSPASRSWKELS